MFGHPFYLALRFDIQRLARAAICSPEMDEIVCKTLMFDLRHLQSTVQHNSQASVAGFMKESHLQK